MKTSLSLTLNNGVAEILITPETAGKPPTVDYAFFAELEAHIKSLEEQADDVIAVLVKSAAPKYFVVGANLEALKKISRDTIAAWVERGHDVFNRLEALPIPTIAVITGYALGGGLELAMACDYILAADTAKFGQPEAGLGFVPGWDGCFRLPQRIGWTRAKELFYTGKIIDAPTAYSLGLANFCGTSGELDAHIGHMIDSMRNNSRLAVGMIKKIINSSMTTERQRGTFAEATASEVCLSSGDTARRLAEFFAKREK